MAGSCRLATKLLVVGKEMQLYSAIHADGIGQNTSHLASVPVSECMQRAAKFIEMQAFL